MIYETNNRAACEMRAHVSSEDCFRRLAAAKMKICLLGLLASTTASCAQPPAAQHNPAAKSEEPIQIDDGILIGVDLGLSGRPEGGFASVTRHESSTCDQILNSLNQAASHTGPRLATQSIDGFRALYLQTQYTLDWKEMRGGPFRIDSALFNSGDESSFQLVRSPSTVSNRAFDRLYLVEIESAEQDVENLNWKEIEGDAIDSTATGKPTTSNAIDFPQPSPNLGRFIEAINVEGETFLLRGADYERMGNHEQPNVQVYLLKQDRSLQEICEFRPLFFHQQN